MEIILERCAGLDVHKKTVLACVLTARVGGPAQAETQQFGTMTADLEALAAWLREQQVVDVVKEATGMLHSRAVTLPRSTSSDLNSREGEAAEVERLPVLLEPCRCDASVGHRAGRAGRRAQTSRRRVVHFKGLGTKDDAVVPSRPIQAHEVSQDVRAHPLHGAR